MAQARVVFSNNYPMESARRRAADGRYPRQHLYGVHALEAAGIAITYADFSYRSALYKASARLGWRLGDLHQELDIARTSSGNTVLYAGEPHHVVGLSRLRSLGIWRHPVVAVVHQEVRPGSRLLDGVDIAICLSRRVREQLIRAHGRSQETALWGSWGPDLTLPAYRSTGAGYVVSTGKSGRDLPTLLAALDGSGIRAKVYALPPAPTQAPPNVELISTDQHEDHGGGSTAQFAFERVIEDIRGASMVAIPLSTTDRLAGLTELCDALALGKPVVMTRTPFIDIDLESIGCGFWIDEGDVDGWRNAVRRLGSDPEMAAGMGAAGRAYAEKECNADTFGEVVLQAVRSLAH